MKFVFLFFVSLLMLVGSAVAAEELDVVITPSSPDTDDDLTAYVGGYEDTTFDFYWMKDGATYKTSTGKSSTLDASFTDAEDTWIVSVWVPESVWFDSYEVGEESVTIEGEAPSTSDGTVVIEPSVPCDEDDLTAYVDGYEDTPFDFYWMKDGATYKTSTGTSSTLSDSYTEVGEEWTVSVWVPESAWYDSFEYGSASVEISDCAEDEENTAPRATDISFTVEEGELVDVDLHQYATLFGYQIAANRAVFFPTQDVPAYDADGDSLEIRYDSLLNSFGLWQTAEGDAGVYTVLAEVSDGTESTEALIEITVEESEGDIPDYSDGEIVVEPSDPCDEDDVTVYVAGYEDITFDFYWILDGVTYYTSTGTSSTLDASYTEIGDAWTVSVWVPESAWYDSFELGSVSFTVFDCAEDEENTAPRAADISFTVEEGDLVDVDLHQYATLFGYQIAANRAVFFPTQDVPAYDADGDSLEIRYDSLLNSFGLWQTAEGDAGVYVVQAEVSDGEASTFASITITVETAEVEDENTAPELEDIADIEITEGESLSVTAVATDADGDALTYSFSIPGGSVLGSTWDWTTTYSDAGQYDVTVSVSDGLASDSTSFTVKVTDVCDDFNANNVCDEDEVHRSDYEGDLLSVDEARVLNAHNLYSAYDVSDMELEISGVFFVDNGYLHSTASDDSIEVYVEMHNRNSFDARDITVSFILNGEEYEHSFSDLDRSEEEGRVYSVPIPRDLETGSYPLTVLVESDDISYETAFNVDIVSLGDYIAAEEQERSVEEVAESLWNKVEDFFSSLF